MERPPDLLQIDIARESAKIFNERKNLCLLMLGNHTLASRIFNDTLNNQEFITICELANQHTSIDHLWNRHDAFHAVSSLLLGLKIVKSLAKTKYSDNLNEYVIPVITTSMLWHDTTRAIIETSDHGMLSTWLDSKLEKLLAKYVDERFITYQDLLKIKTQSIYCIIQHNRPEKCSHLDAALVRIAEALDCDKYRSYIAPLYSWDALLRNDQLTHVLGTLLIDSVDVQYSGDEEHPVLITLRIIGNSNEWKKYNWFQVQDRVKKKVESSGFAYLFKLKIIFENGKEFYYEFIPARKPNCLNQIFPDIFNMRSNTLL